MNDLLKFTILKMKAYEGFSISVEGVSMMPLIKKGDIISIMSQSEYALGDVILFNYKSDGFLLHRILKIEEGRYFCKGDNSFRLEDICKDNIVGKATLCNGKPISKLNEDLIDMSYKIHDEFRRNGYSRDKIVNSKVYLDFKSRLKHFNVEEG